MNKTKINAIVVADSINSWGNRITSLLVTMPRLVLAEFNTHRMFSRNTSSSRAIPFNKMVESVEKDPFIPIAWQKDHKGMQGNEYFNNPTEKFEVEDQELYELLLSEFEEVGIVGKTDNAQISIEQQWLYARDNAIISAKILSKIGITKQLCNRLLEPFMWTTVLVTATEWENFFKLRCPEYEYGNEVGHYGIARSRKDYIAQFGSSDNNFYQDNSELDWLCCNKSQAEIHIQAVAECMWDAINESTPKQLKAGEWHIPFGDSLINHLEEDGKHTDSKIDIAASWLGVSSNLDDIPEIDEGGINYDDWLLSQKIKIATARCARTSYTVIGEKGKTANYENDIKLHDRLIESGHWSPFEHCAKVMTDEEYEYFINGKFEVTHSKADYEKVGYFPNSAKGWCNNFKGFIQYRYLIETNHGKNNIS